MRRKERREVRGKGKGKGERKASFSSTGPKEAS